MTMGKIISLLSREYASLRLKSCRFDVFAKCDQVIAAA